MSGDDVDAWIYFDGPEPERIRPLLDALRDLPAATPRDKERVARRFFERLDATLAGREGQAAPSVRPEVQRRVAEDGATARSPVFEDRGDALPLEPRAPGPLVEVLGSSAAPVTMRVEAPGPVRTAMALELPPEVREQLGRLPFRPAAEVQAAGKVAARTLQVPVMRRGHGETAPIGDDSIAKAVAALPFAGSTAGAGVVAFPQLKLEEYASLRAELSVWPERAGEILRRYHVVNEAAQRALDEHWEGWFVRQPEARVVFERGCGGRGGRPGPCRARGRGCGAVRGFPRIGGMNWTAR